MTFDLEPDIRLMGGGFDGMELAMPAIMDVFKSLSAECDEVKATWFITHDNGAHIDTLYENICVDLASLGQELGLHVHFNKSTGKPCFERECQAQLIQDGAKSLRSKGFKINSFRGGAFYLDAKTIRILEENDIYHDSSVIPGSKYVSQTIPEFHFDHSRCVFDTPYHPSYQDHCFSGNAKLLEVPLFVDVYFKRTVNGMGMQMNLLISKKRNSLVNCIQYVIKTNELPAWLISTRNNIVVLMAHSWEFIDKTPDTKGMLKIEYIDGLKRTLELLKAHSFALIDISSVQKHSHIAINKTEKKCKPVVSIVREYKLNFTLSLVHLLRH